STIRATPHMPIASSTANTSIRNLRAGVLFSHSESGGEDAVTSGVRLVAGMSGSRIVSCRRLQMFDPEHNVLWNAHAGWPRGAARSDTASDPPVDLERPGTPGPKAARFRRGGNRWRTRYRA